MSSLSLRSKLSKNKTTRNQTTSTTTTTTTMTTNIPRLPRLPRLARLSRLAALALGSLLLSALQPFSPSALSASAASAPMLTPWSADAQAGRGWQEYPRPQMTRDTWQNLNGQWDYAITPYIAPPPQKYDGQIRVPYPVESHLSGVTKTLNPDQRLWYHRTFTIPATWTGQRVLLHFGAVDWETHIFVNGGIAGSHRGGSTPFTLDITPFLKTANAATQDIIIAVYDPTNAGEQPIGKQRLERGTIWYTPTSGIWQTVWLEPVPPEMSIAHVKCVPDLDAKLLKLTTLGDHIDTGNTHYAIRARVLDDGKLIAEASGRLNRELTIPIPNPVAWSPDTPRLYDLQIDLYRIPNPFAPAADNNANAKGKKGKKNAESKKSKAGAPDIPPPPLFGPDEQKFYASIPAAAKQLDSVKSYFAMRKISLGKSPKGVTIMLNNTPLFQLGPLDQGYWPDGLLTPPTETAMRYDLDFLKRAGFNMLRKHIKVEPALYYAYCDKIGLLVWQDMPSGMAQTGRGAPEADTQHVRGNSQGEGKKRPEVAANYENELREMLEALQPFPSIVIWTPFNEGWGQYDSARIAANVKALDPTRLVNAASGWLDTGAGDILDYHQYRPNKLNANVLSRKDDRRALVLGEFGGLNYVVEGHRWFPDKLTKNYQSAETLKDYEAGYIARLGQMRDVAKANGLCAAVYTQTTDVEGEMNGFLTYDRKVAKLPAERLAEIYKSLGL